MLIWDLKKMPETIEEPMLTYQSDGEVSTLQWSMADPDWLSIAFDNKVQMLRV